MQLKMPWILYMVMYVPVVRSYDYPVQCPSRTEWRMRAKWNCNGSSTAIYTCLFNVFKNKYEEACKYKYAVLDPGEQYVLSHLPSGEQCNTGEIYQPFPLSLNMSSECVIRKSMCNAEGQVLFYNGSSREDRSCRCDFDKGYAFVNRPQHQCKCTPSLEDCSCYRKQCSSHYRLTQDYACVHDDNKLYISPCPDMVYSRHKSRTATSDLNTLSIKKRYGNRNTALAICITVLFGIIIAGAFTFAYFEKIEHEVGLLYTEISAPYNINVTREDNKLKLTWSKPRNGSNDIEGYRIYCAYNSTCEKEAFIVKGPENLCFYVTSEDIDFIPRTTYRFTVSAYTSSSTESIQSDEATYETGTPKQPNNIVSHGRDGTITLAWSCPKEYLFNVDTYQLDITLDIDTTVELSAETLEYKIEEAQHKIYRFKIYTCSNGFFSKPLEHLFNGGHAYRADMKLDIEIMEFEEKMEKLVEKKFLEFFDSATKNTPGEQEVSSAKIRTGSLLFELVFSSHNFYDEKVLHQTIQSAFERNRIGEWELILREFSLLAANNPASPQSVNSSSKDNIATVTWEKPEVTFFKTERYIVQIMTKNGSSTDPKEYEVAADQMCYSVSDGLPSTTIEFKIYTGTCHSIRSYASDLTCIFVEGPSPPQNVTAAYKESSIELSWTKPSHPILKFVTQFKIKVTENQTSFHIEVKGDTLIYELLNCKPLTNYSFQLFTLTSNGLESEASETVDIQTQVDYGMAQMHVERNRFTQTSSFVIKSQYAVEDVKLLLNGKLVFSDRYAKRLMICLLNGEQTTHIPLTGQPFCIAVTDDCNVAVSLMIPHDINKSLRHFEITLVNIQTLRVIRNMGFFQCVMPSCPIAFANNKLYIHARLGEIRVMDMNGQMKATILLSSTATSLSGITYVKTLDSICGMSFDGENILSIDQSGICTTIYEFKEDKFYDRKLDFDQEGNYLVFCSHKYKQAFKVYKISPSTDTRVKLLSSKITKEQAQDQQNMYAHFCVQNLTKTTIVVIKCNEVHVYSHIK